MSLENLLHNVKCENIKGVLENFFAQYVPLSFEIIKLKKTKKYNEALKLIKEKEHILIDECFCALSNIILAIPHQEQFDPEKYAKYLEQERMSEKVNINNINMDDEKQVELYENYLLNYKYNKRQVEKNGTLPLSLLSSSFIRRTIYSNREDVLKKLKNINWKKYCCNVKGVRWHASGAWRVYFCKRNYQHNFFVKCDCYFRVGIYGFEKSKELAVLYRKRLEYEYLLLMKRWKEIEV